MVVQSSGYPKLQPRRLARGARLLSDNILSLKITSREFWDFVLIAWFVETSLVRKTNKYLPGNARSAVSAMFHDATTSLSVFQRGSNVYKDHSNSMRSAVVTLNWSSDGKGGILGT